MRWKPELVRTGAETWPGASAMAASANGFSTSPSLMKPRSPPRPLVFWSSEAWAATAAKSSPFLQAGRQRLDAGAGRRLVAAGGAP